MARPATNPGELPELPKLTELVQSLGLTPATHAIVVSTGADATDFGAAARVYWTLKLLGLKELSVLNGGMKAWNEQKLPQDNEAVKVARSSYQPQLDTSLIATRADVGQPSGSATRPWWTRAPTPSTRARRAHLPPDLGHPARRAATGLQPVVCARHLHLCRYRHGQADRGQGQARAGPDMVAFCNTGHWAATNWFGLPEVAGLPGVKLYAGSMVDWTQQADAPPMANQPGRAESLAYDAKQWGEKEVQINTPEALRAFPRGTAPLPASGRATAWRKII
ncbi:3-mercaptopyruvate sulfurtransferase [Manis javanica]|nr:3-mercaptopyruvate sulfurtransferase [Manis javanica]